ncbi:LOW QUALITY PROTEIN: hypothetical protein TorRG33x02_261970 [Trema orientale]|uniref:Uncharacterized protein n=1 Tax=Trema orientale TaxID=63057 RepID=A0A2P5D5A9_TREOI|nr:LOW QUALITY PROTEIN: hypothetical protein TorRG33x02_261970 [Trema orientale]
MLLSSGTEITNISKKLMPSAISLQEIGINFKEATNTFSIFDVEFKNGILQIPPLLIDRRTEPHWL